MASKAELVLVALTKKATKDIKSFATDSSGALKALGAVAAGALAVFASKQILDGIATVTDAAAKQEVAVNKLNSALKLAGDFSVDASNDMQKFASELQSITTVGDETTLEMLALAKSFGVSNEGAKELVDAAVDLAEVTGSSLESAVRNLGKTYGGLTGELGEVIPALKELTVEQLKSGEAIKFVEQRFGGAATAATQTYSGAVAQLSNAFGDLQEELGEIITNNPVVIELIHSLRSAFEDLGVYVSENQDSVRGLLNDAIRALVDFTPDAVRRLSQLGKVFIAIGRSVAGAVAYTGSFFDVLISGSDDVADALKLITNPMNAIVLGMTSLQKFKLEFDLNSAIDDVQDLKDEFKELAQSSDVVPIEKFRDLKDQIKAAEDRVTDLRGEIKILEDTGTAIAIEIEGNTEPLKRQIQDTVKGALRADDFLVKAEIQLNEATDAMVGRLEGISNKLATTSNSKGTGTGGLQNNVPAQPSDLQKLKDFFTGDFGKAVGSSILQNITKGQEGGQAVLGAGAGALATAAGLPPEVAGPLGSIVTELAGASKEGAKQMAKDFALGITEGIKALVENVPVFIEALAENSGEIITAIIAAGPKITAAFIKMQPMIAKALIQEFVDGFKYQMEKLGPGFAQFGQDFKEGVQEAGEAFVEYIQYELPAALQRGLDALVGGFHHISQQFVNNVLSIPDALGRQLPLVITKAFTDAGNVISNAGAKFRDSMFGAGETLARFFKEDIIGGLQKAYSAFYKQFEKGGQFIKNLGDGFAEAAKQFIKTLIDRAQGVVDALSPGRKDGKKSTGGFEEVTGIDVPGVAFATGGIVKGLGTKDTVPAMLTPGELVIDRTTGPRLNRFLDSAEAAGTGGLSNELLLRIISLLERPQTVQTSIQIGTEVIGDVMLQLERANARLRA